MPADEAIVFLSVRTGWDLLLTALALPAGSEVVTSAVTIPDMVRIIEHHGLTPVPVDVDAVGLEIDLEQLERLHHAADAGNSCGPLVRQSHGDGADYRTRPTARFAGD